MRLEAQAKAGYYPTPPVVVERVARLVRVGPVPRGRAVRILDPCCGTGYALRLLCDLLSEGGPRRGYETYGVELHRQRAEEARRALDHTLCSDLFQTSIAHSAFHLLWLNPPYDYDDEARRLEHRFLVHCTKYLAPGGLLVFIVPQRRLAHSARFLSSHYTCLACWRFPDPEFQDFRQAVLLGVRKRQATPDPESEARVKAWAEGDLSVLPEAGEPLYTVPFGPAGPVLFTRRFFDPEVAAEEARERGLWASKALQERLWPVEEAPVRPLMPLRKGHLALLIAAGFLNNLVLEGERRVLVKGRTHKEFVLVDETEETETYREFLRTSVLALDLDTGEFFEVRA